jgi:excinuclease UvrABC ATPase subunit
MVKSVELKPKMQLDRFVIHDIELIVDSLTVNEKSKDRLRQALQTGMKQGKGLVVLIDTESQAFILFFKASDVCRYRHLVRRAIAQFIFLQLAVWRLSELQRIGADLRSVARYDYSR